MAVGLLKEDGMQEIGSRLTSWGGRALIASGLFGVAATLLHPEGETAEAFVAPNWTLAHAIEIGWIGLLLFGLVSLYSVQASETGNLGFLSFIAAFVGTALLVGVVTLALALPILAEADPKLIAAEGPLFTDPAITTVFFMTLITFLLGYVGFGVATMRARVLPSVAGVGLSVGAVLHAGGEFGFPWPVVILGGIVFSLASIWMGWSVSSLRKVEAFSEPVAA